MGFAYRQLLGGIIQLGLQAVNPDLSPRSVAAEAHVQFVSADESTFRKTLLGGDNMVPLTLIRDLAATVASRNTRFEWLNGDEAPVAESIVAESLFGATELRQDERGTMLGRPFKDWMTFLDPDQIGLVNINFTGPARFSGPAGTGKTVVALQRMARFLKESLGWVMFTSFVKTLPNTMNQPFSALPRRPSTGPSSEVCTPGPHDFSEDVRSLSPSPTMGPSRMPSLARAARHVLGEIRWS